MKKDLLTIEDLTKDDILKILKSTEELKKDKFKCNNLLDGKSIALVFQKSSNRTRVSFEVGISQLGGNCVYLGPKEIKLGVRESVSDAANTLARYVDGIVARTYKHQDIIDLAKYANIPIINGLSDLYHPCQGLTDIFSVKEKFGTLDGITVSYVGDGNNVCTSLLFVCAKLGVNVNIATPDAYRIDSTILDKANSYAKQSGAKINTGNDPKELVKGVDVIYADVWVSMGQEDETAKRLKDFEDFQINKNLADLANKDFVFMHCLPAHRGQEVTGEVIDGPNSIVFDQAENRLHTQKAILKFLFQ